MRRLPTLLDDDVAENAPILWLIAIAMWLALIVNSFYNDDSPLQFRAHCAAGQTAFSQCSESLDWIGFR